MILFFFFINLLIYSDTTSASSVVASTLEPSTGSTDGSTGSTVVSLVPSEVALLDCVPSTGLILLLSFVASDIVQSLSL